MKKIGSRNILSTVCYWSIWLWIEMTFYLG